MKLVLDSNIVFSALIKKSTTRNIILSNAFELHAPEHIFIEITKHRKLLLRKSKMNEGDFDALLLLLQKHIHLPFLALALALGCPIWSNDGHFKQQNKVVVYTTEELKTADERKTL